MERELTDAEMRRQIEVLISYMSDEEVRRAHAALNGRTVCRSCKGDGKSRTQVLTSNPPQPARCEHCDGRGWFGFEQQEGASAGYGVVHLDPEVRELGIRMRQPGSPELPPVVDRAIDIVTSVNQHLVAHNARLHRTIVDAYEMLTTHPIHREPGSSRAAVRIHNTQEILRHHATRDDRFAARMRGEVTA